VQPHWRSRTTRSRLASRHLTTGGPYVDTELVQFTLPDGSSLLVEVDDQEPGIQRASRVDDLIVQAKHSLDDALDHIQAMATLTLTKLQDLPRRPDDLEVEFGVRLNAEAGAVIAKTQAEGHLKVKLAWKATTPGA
jgi:Trypsin-co-occurring domain 1